LGVKHETKTFIFCWMTQAQRQTFCPPIAHVWWGTCIKPYRNQVFWDTNTVIVPLKLKVFMHLTCMLPEWTQQCFTNFQQKTTVDGYARYRNWKKIICSELVWH